MNSLIDFLNTQGDMAWDFVQSMLWQSSLVILLVLLIDRCLRNRVSAATRYVFSLLMLLKLLLPPSLSLPTSPAYWVKSESPAAQIVTKELPQATATVVRRETPVDGVAPVDANPAPKLTLTGVGWLLSIGGVILFVALVMARVLMVRRLISDSMPG